MYKHNLTAHRCYEALQKRALKKGRASSMMRLNNQDFRLWILKNSGKTEQEPLIYLLTNILDKRNTTDLYLLRWCIEYLFKHLKTNGYNLEDLRVTNLDKIRLLIAMVRLAYIVSILTALQERKNKPVKKKIYGLGVTFDAISVFKQGQSLLKQAFISLRRFLDIIQFINIPICSTLPFNKSNVQ